MNVALAATKARNMLRSFFGKIPNHRRHLLLALLVFTFLATVLINQALLPDYTLLPLDLIQSIAPWDNLDLGPLENSLISDPLYYFYPSRFIQTAEMAKGQIPLWNPYILTGNPEFANPNFQPFYLPNLIASVFLPVHHALPWLAWSHLILTGLLMYGLLRQLKLHWLASIMGGGIWMLNGYLVVWLENPHRLSTLAWLPGIFWAYQKAVDERRLDYAALGGVLLGISILGGQIQFIFSSGLVLGLYASCQVIWDAFKEGRLSLRPLIPLVIIGIIGLGIGAIMLLPAGEFAAFSQRVRFTTDSVLRTRFPWEHLVTLIAPDFFGNPANPEGYWGKLPNYAELAIYFGTVSFLLALTAPFVARQRKFAFSTITITLFVLASIFGTPLVKILFLIPGSQFIVLNRLLFLLPLCGAWLAAIGLDGWLAAPKKRRWILLPIWFLLLTLVTISLLSLEASRVSSSAVIADLTRSGLLLVLATGLLLTLPRRPRLLGIMLVLLIFVDLLQWGWDFNPTISTTYLYPENRVVEYLRKDTSHYRVLPLQSEKLIFGPNVLTVFGFETISAYSSLILSNYSDLYKEISDQVDFAWLASSPNKLEMSVFEPEVSLLNVKYILSVKPQATDERLQVENLACDSTLSLDNQWTTQTFTASEPGLNRIDILLAPPASSHENATVHFQLWHDEIEGELVAESEILIPTTDVSSSHTIYFAPVPDSAGQSFVWGVTGEESIAICTVGSETNLAFNAYGTQLISRADIDGIKIYENPNTLPRAYLVHHAETVSSDQLLDRLINSDFDFYHSILLTTPLPEEQADQLAARPIRSQGQVEVIDYGLQRVALEVTTSQPGILVLADAKYPGWQVIVNGTEQEIVEVNSIFRGVFLPAGTHSITFQFRPLTLYWGIVIAILSLALAIIIALVTFIRRKKGQSSTPSEL